MQQLCNSCDEYRDIVIDSDCWSCVWARAEEVTTERIIKLLGTVEGHDAMIIAFEGEPEMKTLIALIKGEK